MDETLVKTSLFYVKCLPIELFHLHTGPLNSLCGLSGNQALHSLGEPHGLQNSPHMPPVLSPTTSWITAQQLEKSLVSRGAPSISHLHLFAKVSQTPSSDINVEMFVYDTRGSCSGFDITSPSGRVLLRVVFLCEYWKNKDADSFSMFSVLTSYDSATKQHRQRQELSTRQPRGNYFQVLRGRRGVFKFPYVLIRQQ